MNAAALIDSLPIRDTEADVATKRSALAAVVREVLGRHDAGFLEAGRVAEDLHKGTILDSTAGEQERVMGRSARYAEVLYRQVPGSDVQLVGGADATTPHTFLVNVFYGAAEGSEGPWTALIESRDPATPGLLVALRALGHLETDSGDVVEVGPPERTVVAFVPARPQRTGLARYQHECSFLITLV